MRAMVPAMDKGPDILTVISYAIAAAILIPVGWWLQNNFPLDDWLRSLFH